VERGGFLVFVICLAVGGAFGCWVLPFLGFGFWVFWCGVGGLQGCEEGGKGGREGRLICLHCLLFKSKI